MYLGVRRGTGNVLHGVLNGQSLQEHIGNAYKNFGLCLKELNNYKINQSCIYEQAETRACQLQFGAESFIFQFAIQKCKD
jgi:hypothetical protein